MNNSDVEKEIINYLQEKEFIVLKSINNNTAGLPIIILLKNGKINFIEVKSKMERLTALQVLKIRQLRDNNFNCYIFNTLDECKSVFL